MSTYYCLLGNTPSFSLAELQVLLPQARVQSEAAHVASLELADDDQARQLMAKLGGTVKIMRHLQDLPSAQPDEVQAEIAKYLSQNHTGPSKLTFGVAEIGRDHLPPLNLFTIKSQLETAGHKVRFIEGSRLGLSAAVLLHQSEVVEINVLQLDEHLAMAQTVGIQDIDAWTVRDREKPYADRRKGMLPPKVARMMVNLALSQVSTQSPLVYDPFCGTGTVLIEALTQGCEVVGSDLDSESVVGTQANLEWFASLSTSAALKTDTAQVFQTDVSQVSLDQVPRPVDAIVTEPFLGKPQPRPEQLPNMFKGLEKLYLGAFKQWRQVLHDQSVVVIIFPQVVNGNHVHSLEGLIDKLSGLGYTIASEPLLYHRPQAIVQRQVYIFKYTKS